MSKDRRPKPAQAIRRRAKLPPLTGHGRLAYEATKLHRVVAALLSVAIVICSGSYIIRSLSPKTAEALARAASSVSQASVLKAVLGLLGAKP